MICVFFAEVKLPRPRATLPMKVVLIKDLRLIKERISFFFDVVNSCSGQRIYPLNYAGSIWPAARRCQ
jgi:hypothetical protein